MPFDIVESLQLFPDLVIATVLEFLPLAILLPLQRSANPELCELAGRQMWLLVDVCTWLGGYLRASPQLERLRISHEEFSKMVRGWHPPPYRIRRLFYTGQYSSQDRLFMTAHWRSYVATHAGSVEFEFDMKTTNDRCWLLAAPHLGSFNLVDLHLWIPGGNTTGVWPLLVDVRLPCTLRKMNIDLGCHIRNIPIDLAIPPFLMHLKITSCEGIHPGSLPELPETLWSLMFRISDGVDMTPFVEFFPAGLRALMLDTYSRPGVVSSGAIQRFGSTLVHNMLVYDSLGTCGHAAARGVPELVTNGGSLARIVSADSGDYSAVVLPCCERLEILSGERDAAPMALLGLNHWLPQLDSLYIELPLSFAGAVVPETVKVEVEGNGLTIPREVWNIHRLTLIEMGPVEIEQLPPELGQMRHLRRLSLTVDGGLETSAIPTPPNLREMKVVLNSGMPPDLQSFDSVRRLELEYPPLRGLVDLRILPMCLELLVVSSRYSIAQGRWALEPPAPVVGFTHLVRLKELVLENLPGVPLAGSCFPDSLVSISIRGMPGVCLDGVQLPPRLERLEIAWCDLTNPWVHSPGVQGHKGHVPVVYPESLRVLDLSGNEGLVPPPVCFLFPPKLRHLSVNHCSITSIAPFRFPSSLDRLDVDGNNFPIPGHYRWPRVSHLTIKKIMTTGTVLTQSEYTWLAWQIPGVRINE